MAFYIHLGCDLSGKSESTFLMDTWIHNTPLLIRLSIMAIVMEL
jgi:hypothetical protein